MIPNVVMDRLLPLLTLRLNILRCLPSLCPDHSSHSFLRSFQMYKTVLQTLSIKSCIRISMSWLGSRWSKPPCPRSYFPLSELSLLICAGSAVPGHAPPRAFDLVDSREGSIHACRQKPRDLRFLIKVLSNDRSQLYKLPVQIASRRGDHDRRGAPVADWRKPWAAIELRV